MEYSCGCFVVLKEPCEPTMKRMSRRKIKVGGQSCQNWQVLKKGDPMDRPCVGHALLRLRMGTADSDEMRNVMGGGWKRTGLSKRVLKSRTGRFIMTTAAHSFTRTMQQSLPLKRMTSPARSRNG